MDFSAMLQGNMALVLKSIMAVVVFFVFAYIPLKLIYTWFKNMGR